MSNENCGSCKYFSPDTIDRNVGRCWKTIDGEYYIDPTDRLSKKDGCGGEYFALIPENEVT